jgi:phosphohistidine phosphatase
LKRLYLLRHAKAESDTGLVPDMERHLSKIGIKEADEISDLFIKKYHTSHIISSPSTRTLETSNFFLNKIDGCNLIVEKSLYLGDIDDVLNVCCGLDDNIPSAMIVFHNPGITYFANVICDANILNVPTCGLLVIDIAISHWKNIDPSQIKLIDFIDPE